MNRTVIKEYVELLSGWSLVYFMLDRMDRDIDMECPMMSPEEKTPMLEDYWEEIIDWVEKQKSVTNKFVALIRYSRTENKERVWRRWR